MNRTEAVNREQELREVLPISWNVVVMNTECRPGKPERFKVCATCAGMTIVVDPEQRFHAYTQSGPGLVDRIAARGMGDPTFDDATGAFTAISRKVAAQHKAFAAMYEGLK